MAEIRVTFEDGAVERWPAGIGAGEAIRRHAERDGAGRARLERAVAARVEADGATVVDLTRPLLRDCGLAPVAVESPEGLHVTRHSAAHLMAQAVKRLFPETQITIGPVIENGFYYDFKRPGGFASEDLPRIEAMMRAIVAEDLAVRREEVARSEAIRRFREMGEHYKVEIIEGIPDETVSLYRQGEFVDLCRGPHVPSTGRIPAFRLTGLAGAYWRGDARNEQLQRIYGTAWASAQDLEAYLQRVEEAKQRDHRRLGPTLDLFSLQPIAPRSPFFHPQGAVVHNLLAGLVRVRSMAQDDAHIYCTPEQLDGELEQFIAMTREVYSAFGFERIEVTLQTRPEKYLGRLELWDAAEDALRRALERAGFAVTMLPGQGAFYGPKIGFDFRDVLERSWTLATVQIDCAMPERFALTYVTAEGTEATPVMLHRAVLGSLERFIAILLEHTAGRLPLWLAPVQVRVLPVSEKAAAYATRVAGACRAAGLRAEADLRNEKLGYKVREAQLEKVPVVAVVGEREAAAGTVAPRTGGAQETVAVEAFVAATAAQARMPGGVP